MLSPSIFTDTKIVSEIKENQPKYVTFQLVPRQFLLFNETTILADYIIKLLQIGYQLIEYSAIELWRTNLTLLAMVEKRTN